MGSRGVMTDGVCRGRTAVTARLDGGSVTTAAVC